MLKFSQKIRTGLRPSYDPDPQRRAEVVGGFARWQIGSPARREYARRSRANSYQSN
jgi:hypothetical protein